MKIEISKDEALVLYDFLYRSNQNEAIVFEDQAEQRVLWDFRSRTGKASAGAILSKLHRTCEESTKQGL